MNVLNALKGLFKGKGGTDVDDFNITDSAVSSTMRSATSLWWDAFQGQLPFAQTHKNFKPLPTAYVSTAYLAQLVTGEIKFEVADEELNKHVQKNLLPNLDRIVQQTLVGGYTVIKPYFVQSGEMFFDSGTSRDFLPMALDENGHITEGVFFERIRYHGKIYERREHHIFRNGVHTVRNHGVHLRHKARRGTCDRAEVGGSASGGTDSLDYPDDSDIPHALREQHRPRQRTADKHFR